MRRGAHYPSGVAPLLVLGLVLLPAAPLAARDGPERADVTVGLTVRLDPESGEVTGTVTMGGPGLDGWVEAGRLLYLHASTLARPEADLNDVTWPLRFPSGYDPAGTEVPGAQPVEAAAGPAAAAGALVRLPRIERDADARVAVSFVTRIPVRFGAFGRMQDRTVVLSAGWHPVPVLAAAHASLTLPRMRLESVRVQVTRAGVLCVGDRLVRVAAGEPVTLSDVREDALPLLYFRERFELTDVRGEGGRLVGRVLRGEGSGSPGGLERLEAVLRDAAALNPRENGAGDGLRGGEAPLLLEAPLRESLALPFPGGALYSDMLYSVTPIERFVARHDDAVLTALVAAVLMEGRGVGLSEALHGATLLELWRWRNRQSRPDFIRSLMRKSEVVGALDKIATDPQTHFESTVFFTSDMSPDVRRTLEYGVEPFPSPVTSARLTAVAFGWDRSAECARRAMSEGATFLATLRSVLEPAEQEVLAAIVRPERIDLELAAVEEEAGALVLTVCKRRIGADAGTGSPGPIPVEITLEGDGKRTEVVAICPDACCTQRVEGHDSGSRVQIDPVGLFDEADDGPRHPRRNDRNYLDMKWMIGRPFFSMASRDELPSVGFELVAQPRYDLANAAFVYPVLVPARAVVMAGLRLGFGDKVRPNFLSDQLSLAVRYATSVEGDGSSIGPAIIYMRHTRQSRNNPFEGSFLELHGVPVYGLEESSFGGRAGFVGIGMVGAGPDHVLALRLSGDTTVGEMPDWESPSTGGFVGVRALAADEVRVRHWAGASVEYRYMLASGWNVSLLDLAYLNGLQVAVFTDGASMAGSYQELLGNDTTFVDAGVSVRPHFQLLGFIPAVMSVDAAWLVPWPHALGPRVTFLLNMAQPF